MAVDNVLPASIATDGYLQERAVTSSLGCMASISDIPVMARGSHITHVVLLTITNWQHYSQMLEDEASDASPARAWSSALLLSVPDAAAALCL